MGCCKIFSASQPREQSKQTELLSKSQFSVIPSTRNDRQFTYFLGVYNLLSLGQKLEMPEYFDELNPNFSYQKFNDVYHQYQREIKNLGKYIEQYNAKDSLLAKRIAIDRLNIQTYRKMHKIPSGGKPGCLVKLQLQDVEWIGAKQIGVKLLHPLNWEGKFEKWTTLQSIQAGPVYIQFPVPNYKEAIIQISAKNARGEIKINIEECINNDQQLIFKVMKWKEATVNQGIALRLQLVSEQVQQQKQKVAEMTELYRKLQQDYGIDDQAQPSMNEKDINERLSRHRSSMNQKYRLTSNSKL